MTVQDWRARYELLSAETDRLRTRLAAVEAERDAARAGEARAVECLKEIDEYNGGADSVLEDEYVTHRRMEVIEGGASSLDWLDQQRREAAAAEVDNRCGHCESALAAAALARPMVLQGIHCGHCGRLNRARGVGA